MSRTRARRALETAAVVDTASELWERVKTNLRSRPWWMTTLLFIGSVTVLMVVSVAFLGVNNAPRTVVTSGSVPPVHSTEFAEALARLVGAPIEHGGTIDVLNNGDEFLPSLLQSLDAAKHTINFSVYIWDDGAMSDQVLDRLMRRQAQGVAVRVMLDGLGARKAPGDLFDDLRALGGRVEKFRTPKWGTWTRFHRRNHRRSIVIDGRVGFTGGMAVSDSWLGHAQDADHWRDMMFKVTGPPAASLQAAFVDEWASSSGEILVGPETYPVGAYGDSPARSTVERFIHHANSPADDNNSMSFFFLMAVLAARETVYVATPYFIPDDPLKEALAERARSGVDVRLLLPGPAIDNRSVRFSGQNHYDALLDAGVRIYEYQPTFLHSKFVVIDSQWSIVGSPNINSRSRYLDEENVFGILDRALGAQLKETFEADLLRAEEIQLETWRKRSPLLRILQLSSRILDQQS